VVDERFAERVAANVRRAQTEGDNADGLKVILDAAEELGLTEAVRAYRNYDRAPAGHLTEADRRQADYDW
jgi:hypothetical protein